MPYRVLMLAFVACVPSAALASTSCALTVFAGPNTRPQNQAYGSDVQWLVERTSDACHVRRISFEKFDCSISVSFEHGYTPFRCGNDLNGKWYAGPKSVSYRPDYPEGEHGVHIKTKLPAHASGRNWLAPIDIEGANYGDFSPDAYVAAYPREITSSSSMRGVDNSDFEASVQTIRYVTMAGKARAAVTGRAKAGCLSIQFVSWVDPSRANATEGDLASMLGDIHLEAVDGPPEAIEQACTGKGRFRLPRDQ